MNDVIIVNLSCIFRKDFKMPKVGLSWDARKALMDWTTYKAVQYMLERRSL